MKTLKRIFLYPPILITFALLILLSLPFLFTDLDLFIASRFYDEGWSFKKYAISEWLYHLALCPGLILTGVFIVIFVLGLFKPKLARYRKLSLVVMLTMVLGPGLFINAVLKNCVDRPRPTDITDFDGPHQYLPLFCSAKSGWGKSFPCGHASLGFVFMALFFATTARASVRWGGLIAGIVLGCLIGLIRIAQGAHFASDVVWAGGVTFLCAAFSYQILSCFPSLFPEASESKEKEYFSTKMTLGKSVIAGTVLLFGSLFLIVFALMAIPYEAKWSFSIANNDQIRKIRFTRLPEYDVRVLPADQDAAVEFAANLDGFGFPGMKLKEDLQTKMVGDCLEISFCFVSNRIITERSGRVEIRVNSRLETTFNTKNRNSNIFIGNNTSPGKYGNVVCSTVNGKIFVSLPQDSQINGSLALTSENGYLKLNLGEAINNGGKPWQLLTRKGNIQFRIWNKLGKIDHPVNIKGETYSGKLVVKADTDPVLPLRINLSPENEIVLKSEGNWQKAADHICSVPDNDQGIDLQLSAPKGKVILDLKN